MSLSKRRVAIVLLLAVVLATGLIYGWHVLHRPPSGVTVLYGDVDIREIDLAFRQSGRLQSMLVDEGARVKSGELVATLDDVPFREALAAAHADVGIARANLTKLLHGNRPQEIAEARDAVAQAKADDVNARSDAVRQQSLLASGSSSQRIVDAANAASRAADAKLASAQQALNLALAGFRQEDVDAGRAQLAAAEAAEASAQTALSDTRLLAPADAIVLSRVREPGSMVTPQAPVYTLTVLSPVYVRAYVKETDLGKMVPGTAVEVSSDSIHHVYHGTIGFVSPRAEFTPKSVETTDLRTDLVYRIRVTIQQPDAELRQGMPVTVRLVH